MTLIHFTEFAFDRKISFAGADGLVCSWNFDFTESYVKICQLAEKAFKNVQKSVQYGFFMHLLLFTKTLSWLLLSALFTFDSDQCNEKRSWKVCWFCKNSICEFFSINKTVEPYDERHWNIQTEKLLKSWEKKWIWE